MARAQGRVPGERRGGEEQKTSAWIPWQAVKKRGRKKRRAFVWEEGKDKERILQGSAQNVTQKKTVHSIKWKVKDGPS